VTIDSDAHLYETRTMWADHMDPAERHRALRIVDDDLGYPWLVHGERRIEVLGIHRPGDTSQSGVFRQSLEEGRPCPTPYDDMPEDFWSPEARLGTLDSFGIAESFLFPNCGIMWEKALAADLAATTANMTAWNRWAVEVSQAGRGRLHPVAHVTLRDPAWLEAELTRLAEGGVRLAMVSPALVDGRRLSHPDHERLWAAFADLDIAVVFHIAQYPMPFDDAWNEGDPDWSNPVLSSVFMWTAPALAIADLAVRGVLARHPRLRVGVVELMSAWLPQFLLMLDGGYSFHAKFNGRPLSDMADRPSSYVLNQVRLASFPFEQPARLARQAGEVFMFGSDYPHPEGVARPIEEFSAAYGAGPEQAPRFFSDNAAWLLGRG
jgi:predicted TIM-barrel fold metal-dependent hydrolase